MNVLRQRIKQFRERNSEISTNWFMYRNIERKRVYFLSVSNYCSCLASTKNSRDRCFFWDINNFCWRQNFFFDIYQLLMKRSRLQIIIYLDWWLILKWHSFWGIFSIDFRWWMLNIFNLRYSSFFSAIWFKAWLNQTNYFKNNGVFCLILCP